eukprot:4787823-Amphidinium_carterae.2
MSYSLNSYAVVEVRGVVERCRFDVALVVLGGSVAVELRACRGRSLERHAARAAWLVQRGEREWLQTNSCFFDGGVTDSALLKFSGDGNQRARTDVTRCETLVVLMALLPSERMSTTAK